MRILIVATMVYLVVFACAPTQPPKPDPGDDLVEKGRRLFFEETFAGNGRTCGSCHPAENNLTIDPAFIATLPDDDPLFVAEFNPELKENFENPRLMREFGLIVENQDGFDDLANNFNMRGVPHTLGLRTSIDSRDGFHTGWSGDGAPGDGSLRSFATGAVIQHFTKTLNRIPGADFRFPTDEELDAMEAFQLSLGRQEEIVLPLPLKGILASRGQEIFNDATSGKCFVCHVNAGANANPAIFGEGAGNLNFNTGVEELPEQPADGIGEKNPPDDGFGTAGNGEFNTPSVIEAADTGPFFHNNSVSTLEGAVAFYNSGAFNNSPAGQLLAGATGSGIDLEVTQVEAVAAFLRVINTLDNIRQSIDHLETSKKLTYSSGQTSEDLLKLAGHETDDSIMVLEGGRLHPIAVSYLEEAKRLTDEAITHKAGPTRLINEAISNQKMARDQMVEQSTTSKK
ncbi:hypothetical protein IH879_13275 [candidate division KSB1 bacterium]|nr:hypothetical protein [candidate division KSB1 bacterium]